MKQTWGKHSSSPTATGRKEIVHDLEGIAEAFLLLFLTFFKNNNFMKSICGERT